MRSKFLMEQKIVAYGNLYIVKYGEKRYHVEESGRKNPVTLYTGKSQEECIDFCKKHL